MPALLWKLPLVVLIVALVGATTLASHARRHDPAYRALAPRTALPLAPDGIARTKRAALQAAHLGAVRRAIEAFVEAEGRRPADLQELACSRPWAGRPVTVDLSGVHYDPQTGEVASMRP